MEQAGVVGYVVNAELNSSPELERLVDNIQKSFENVWLQPAKSRHVTLMDWLAPLVSYNQPADVLFEALFKQYDETLMRVTDETGPINVTFNKIRGSEKAIYIVGEDGGEFNEIRSEFLKNAELVTGTKLPPTIIHSTLARFADPVKESEMSEFLSTQEIEISETVTEFRLLRETVSPMVEYEVIKKYQL